MLVFAEITTRLHLASADERLLVVVAVWMIRKMMSVFFFLSSWTHAGGPAVVHCRMSAAWYLLRLTGWWCPAQCVHSLSRPRVASHLEATVLDVVELQAEGLYAADDSPLMADQTDPDAPDVPEAEKANIYGQVRVITAEGRQYKFRVLKVFHLKVK